LNLANQNAVYFQALPKHIGASAGLLRTFMYMGTILSSATNGLFFKSEANTKGIHHLALFSLIICFILIVTLFDQSLSKILKNR
jgi:hypothetical protein